MAQQGRISGSVVDQAGAPLPAARILLGATNQGAVTNSEGKYVIAGVAPGTYLVRVAIIGYAGESQRVTVGAGESVPLDFKLKPVALSLDAVLVTTSGEQRSREIANNIPTIRAADITETQPITNMSDLLSGRASGVNVLPSSGTVGAGTRIRIRGANSVSQQNDPLIVVDGARVDGAAGSYSLYVGGQEPSRINDLNPDEIASIEIVKGPSAAALYGTQAANGVVLITTKRGTAGKPRWNFYTEQGLAQDVADYPANYDALTAAGARCRLVDASAGSCVQDRIVSFNPLK
ncbi:MAG: hypothetical protein DMD36_02530, partial [Gemmatimonadetes bacterium]